MVGSLKGENRIIWEKPEITFDFDVKDTSMKAAPTSIFATGLKKNL